MACAFVAQDKFTPLSFQFFFFLFLRLGWELTVEAFLLIALHKVISFDSSSYDLFIRENVDFSHRGQFRGAIERYALLISLSKLKKTARLENSWVRSAS